MHHPFARTLVVALALGLAAEARAADLADGGAVQVEAAPAAPLWSGPWIGVLRAAGRIGGEGALGGVALGYAAQFDRIVVGIDGDVSGGGLDARRLGGRYDLEAFGAIRARVGYAFDRFVAFGTAGVAFASAEFARSGERDRQTHVGWTVGAGIDVAITERLSARAEYLYVDLDTQSFGAGGDAAIGPSGSLARLGLNYRF